MMKLKPLTWGQVFLLVLLLILHFLGSVILDVMSSECSTFFMFIPVDCVTDSKFYFVRLIFNPLLIFDLGDWFFMAVLLGSVFYSFLFLFLYKKFFNK